MNGNMDMFANINESMQLKVKLRDDNKVIFMDKGNIKFETKQGEKKHIPNVYYVPNIKHNLIIIGELLQKAYKVYLEIMHAFGNF